MFPVESPERSTELGHKVVEECGFPCSGLPGGEYVLAEFVFFQGVDLPLVLCLSEEETVEWAVFWRVFVEGVLCFLGGFLFQLFLDLLSEVFVLCTCCCFQELLCFEIVFESCLSYYSLELFAVNH